MNYTIHKTILKAENLGLTIEDKVILRDINFEIKDIHRPGVQQGQVVSLVGRSGVGKTQLFKTLAGLQKPTTGSIYIGEDLHPVKAGEVGIVPQNYILFKHRTIFENLALGLKNSGRKLSEEEQRCIIHEFCQLFDISDQLKKYPIQLSGGQRQRVSIIQQLLAGNQFILLDEPFSGLDLVVVEKVIQLLIQVSLLNELNTLILVSHDILNSIAISDSVYILSSEIGKPGATFTRSFDLCKMGLAWDPEIRRKREFIDLIEDVKHLI